MRRTRVAVAAVLALAAAGCSSSAGHKSASSGSGSAGSTPPPSTSAAAPASTPPATTPASTPATSPASSSAPLTNDQLAGALLTPTDLGAGFTKVPFTRNKKPLPCAPAGGPSFDAQAPTDLLAGTQLVDSAQSATVSEELRVYPDLAHATAALRIGTAGLSCAAGRIYATDGTSVQVKIGKGQDVTAQVGGTKAIAWDATSSQVDVLFVAVQLNRALVVFSYVRSPQTDTSKLPNPLAVTKAAIQKIESS